MSDLVESILSEDYVSASSIFEARLNEIAEKKLIEMKKCIQAEAAGGGMSHAEFLARKRLGWRPAKEVLPDPRDYVMKIEPKPEPKKPAVKKRKRMEEETSEADIQAAMAKLQQKRHPGIKAVQQYTDTDIKKRSHVQKQQQTPKVSPAVSNVVTKDKQKRLKSPNAGKDLQSRYADDISRARELQRRGVKGAVSRVKWSGAGMKARASRELGNFGSFMKGLGSNIISGLGEDTETK